MALPVNKFTNRATAKLAADVASNDTALTVEVGAGEWFPNPTAPDYFRVVVQKGTSQTDQREYMVCTSRAGDVLTVTRAQEGTPAAAFTTGDEVSLVATAASLDEFVQKAGPVMKGALEVEADPVAPLGVATKQMVDATAFPEAPVDGESYARKDAAWAMLGDAAGAPLPIPISAGGTGGVDLAAAQTNLYIPVTTFDDLEPATKKYGDRWIRPGNMTELVWAPNAGGGGAGIWINPADAASEAYPISVDKGGTGATTAAQARINLGITNAGGQWVLADGTVAAPGLAFNSEPGLGWFRQSASRIGMAAQGAQTMVFDANTPTLTTLSIIPRAAGAARLILGANPQGAADINSVAFTAAGTNYSIAESLAGAATAKGMLFSFPAGVSVSHDLNVQGSFLKIGTGLAGATLELNAQAGAGKDILGRSVGVARWLMRLGNGSAGGDDFQLFRYNDAGTIIDVPLTISRATGDVSTNNHTFTTGTGSLLCANGMRFDAGATVRYFSMGSGATGDWRWIWNTANGDLIWHRGGVQTDTVFQAGGNFISGGSAIMCRDGTGLALVDSVSSTAVRFSGDNWRMSWSGGSWFLASPSTNIYTFGMDANAQKVAGPTTWTVTSDRRIKDNIEDYTGGLAQILALRPRTYRLKPMGDVPDDEATYVGLVADEAEKAMPELVTRGPGQLRDGTQVDDLAQMNIDPMVYAMRNAIATLHERITQLEKA